MYIAHLQTQNLLLFAKTDTLSELNKLKIITSNFLFLSFTRFNYPPLENTKLSFLYKYILLQT